MFIKLYKGDIKHISISKHIKELVNSVIYINTNNIILINPPFVICNNDITLCCYGWGIDKVINTIEKIK